MPESTNTSSENGAGKEPLTIQRVADDLGVHYSTVSLALSGKGRVAPATRERVISYAAQLGFEPDTRAQSLRRRADSNVICLCSGAFDPGLAALKTAMLQNALMAAGWDVPIHSPSSQSVSSRTRVSNAQVVLFQQLRRQRPRAIICSAHAINDNAFEELKRYQSDGGLVITYDVPAPLTCDQIIFDREDNGYQGARYLLEHGHRDIGIAMSHIPETPANADTIPQNLRMRGFLRALREFDVPVHDEWLFFIQGFELGGAELAQRFLSLSKRPTALCIVNDHTALAFMVEASRYGVRIPQDVSIIGHNNQPVASFCPVSLTSISQPEEAIVNSIVQITLERIGGDTQPPQTLIIKGDIVERESVLLRSTV